MNTDSLTIREIKKLKSLLNGEKLILAEEDLGINIVILQRGWVFVGHLYRKGNDCRLENASVIRNWGTTKGLGEIASGGPTSNTKLDETPTVNFHILTVVATIKCEEEKWKK